MKSNKSILNAWPGISGLAIFFLSASWVSAQEGRFVPEQGKPDYTAHEWSLPDLPVIDVLDADDSGALSALEMLRAAEALKTLDQNQDELLDSVELGGPGPMPGWLRLQVPIKVIDTDGDDQLSFKEIEKATAALKRADVNRDWSLDNSELFDRRVKPRSAQGLSYVDPMITMLARKDVVDPILPGADERQYDGYFIYTESNTIRDTTINAGTKLLDSNGRLIHSWEAEFAPEGVNSYFLDSGLLLRQRGLGDYLELEGLPIASHGIIELVDWDGEVVWGFQHCVKNNVCLHHDMAPMPNGNILVLEYVAVTKAELLSLGRTPRKNEGSLRWFERILEIQPNLTDGSTEIVWIWDSRDHLVQDKYPDKPNYGSIRENHDRFDINFPKNPERQFHFNGIDYNSDLDQIAVTSVNHSELYILDHSTTTEEASGSTGGRYGKGGRILFRWGNPEAYGFGDSNDAILGGAHDPKFLTRSGTGMGRMTVNNNRAGLIPNAKPTGAFYMGAAYSSVLEFSLPTNPDGSFRLGEEDPYSAIVEWEYIEQPLGAWQSPFAGSATRLPNGNTIVMNSQTRRVFEVTSSKERVLDFELPGTGRPQKVNKLPKDHAGLKGKIK